MNYTEESINDIKKNSQFYCKSDGTILKNLFELLNKNIKNGCFNINSKGMFFRMADSSKKMLINIELFADNFPAFSYKFKEPNQQIGLNLSNIYKDIKNIKAKENLLISICKGISMLNIDIISKDNGRLTNNKIKIQDIQVLDMDLPEGYDNPINIPSKECLKIFKDMLSVGSNILEINSYLNLIKFSADSNDIHEKNIFFGEGLSTEDEICYQRFESKQFSRIQKITSLGNKIQFYQKDGLPILLKSNIGDIGTISIYIKDIDQYIDN